MVTNRAPIAFDWVVRRDLRDGDVLSRDRKDSQPSRDPGESIPGREVPGQRPRAGTSFPGFWDTAISTER